MGNMHKEYLEAIGIDIWAKKQPSVKAIAMPEETSVDPAWSDLEKAALCCQKCELCKTRKNVVFGVGNKKADLLLIGEAPGAKEDEQGEPFVGRAGMLLTEIIKAIDLGRKDVYIANILKCRPPNNRDPNPKEVASCTPHLKKQIELIQPKLIVAVGRIAAQFLLNTQDPLSKLRHRVHEYGEQKIPLYVIYHPAYLLRSPREKAKAYDDILKVQELLENNC